MMSVKVTCPDCGETCSSEEIERIDDEPDVAVARRTTGFSGNVTSLNELGHFGFMVELPCGCQVFTVN